MKLNVYSIYDNVAEVFNKPFTDINDGTATRAFTNSVSKEINKDDFVLYRLGSFADNNGSLVSEVNPVKIYSGFDVKLEKLEELSHHLQNQAV